MNQTRREFLATAVVGAIALPVLGTEAVPAPARDPWIEAKIGHFNNGNPGPHKYSFCLDNFTTNANLVTISFVKPNQCLDEIASLKLPDNTFYMQIQQNWEGHNVSFAGDSRFLLYFTNYRCVLIEHLPNHRCQLTFARVEK